MSIKNKYLGGIFLLLASTVTHADVKLPAIISDNMVLQQKATVSIWGRADPGEGITVKSSWNDQAARAVTDEDGKWLLHIKTSQAGGPYIITVSGKNTITLHNVMLGEVWLCSGQSNMEFSLGKQQGWKTGVLNAEAEIAIADYPSIRMFTVEKNTSVTPLEDAGGSWAVCSPQTAGRFSAVAYYFARKIQKETGFPVGLIHSSWGGTPAESWTSKEVLESDGDFKPILDRYEESISEYPGSSKKYQRDIARWKMDTAAAGAGGMPRRPVTVQDPEKNPKSPMLLFNAMIHPLLSFSIKGVIWYQGESNADRAYQYRKLFPALILSWRKDWKMDLPFYFVEIAPFAKQNPEIREAQLLTFMKVPNTGIVVITDAGDSLTIHPQNKEIVGDRLALWALAKNYGKSGIAFSGPIYQSMKIKDGRAVLHFRFAQSGLVAKGGSLDQFTIAGDDRRFVAARAVIRGNTVIVWTKEIKHPVAVRFAWKNFMHPHLYNGDHLPASPFRTDEWRGETYGKN